MQALELIDRASSATGSDYALAKQLGTSRQTVSDWRHGRKTCPPDMRARLAEIAGLDPVDAALYALAESLSEQRRHGLTETLRRAGRAVLPGIGGMLLAGLMMSGAPAARAADACLCIMSNRRRRIADAVQTALRSLSQSPGQGMKARR